MGMTGLQLLRSVKSIGPDIQIIFMATYAEGALTLEAIQLGAFDLIYKPIQDINEIITAVDRVTEKMFMEASNEELYNKLTAGRDTQRRLRARFKTERDYFNTIINLSSDLSRSKDVHESIEKFLLASHTAYSSVPVIFFRHLAKQEQFVLAQMVGLENDSLKGVQLGISLEQIEQDPESLNDSVMALFEKEGFEYRFLKEDQQTVDISVVFCCRRHLNAT